MADIIISLFLFLALSQNQRHLHTPNRTEEQRDGEVVEDGVEDAGGLLDVV